MIDCDVMLDRMPDVAHGTSSWTAEERDHLAACRDCQLAWEVVTHGMALGAGVGVDADRVADGLLRQLRAPVAPSPGRTIRWRGAAAALIAIAACAVLVLSLPQRTVRPAAGASDSTGVVAIIPELQQLDDKQLESVRQSMGASASDATPGTLPHLGDLTDSELEQLLHSEGGQ